MGRHQTLIIADCPGWAVDRLMLPLTVLADICYHYISTVKDTGIQLENPKHLVVELLDDYEQINLNMIRNTENLFKNKDVLDRIKDKRLILTIHTERKSDLEILRNKEFEKIDTFIAPTRYVKQKVKEYTGKEAVYIPHAIDESKYPFMEDYPTNRDVIGFIGRAVPHKRLLEVCQVAKKLNMRVFGCGYVDKSPIPNYYRNCEATGVLDFKTLIPEKEKLDFISRFTIFANLSEPYIEVGPLGVLECAARGIPIITTIQGWAKDNLMESSICMPQLDIEEFLLKDIMELRSDKELCNMLREKARKVIDNWKLKDYIEAYRKVYED